MPLKASSMMTHRLTEPQHLEQWIIANIEVIDDSLKIVTTQYNKWESEEERAQDRLDILAISTSGELVVIELKRSQDKKVLLQGLNYAAMTSTFTKEKLAEAHADWWNERQSNTISPDEALKQLEEHVEEEWTEELFKLPRIILVAETFPAQVLTTAMWLADVAPDIVIECHEYTIFEAFAEPGTNSLPTPQMFERTNAHQPLVAAFRRLYPVVDPERHRLRATGSESVGNARREIDDRKRRAKSVQIISDNELIPLGASIELDLSVRLKPEMSEKVNKWLETKPERNKFTWKQNTNKPLYWEWEPENEWTPTSLRNAVFEQAGVEPPSGSALDIWKYDGTTLYWVAENFLSHGSDAGA